MIRKAAKLALVTGLLVLGVPMGAAHACMADQTVAVLDRSDKGATLDLTFPSKQLARFDDDHDGRLSLAELKQHAAAIQTEVSQQVTFSPEGDETVEPLATPDFLAANAMPGYPLASLRVKIAYDVHPRRMALHYHWFPIHSACEMCIVTDHTGGGMAFFPLDATTPDHDLYAESTPLDWHTFAHDGFWHILTGYDHLLFLLALLLGGGGLKRQLGIVTAFTLAHSLTLALAVFGLANFPGAWVEAGIALTILYAAIENLRGRQGSPLPVVCVFGLIHGLGFADGLRQLGLTGRELAPALLGYNVGVEAGQLLVVLLAYGLVLRRVPEVGGGRAVRRAGSLGLAAVGAGWFLVRVAAAV